VHVNLSLLFALAFGFVAASAPGGVAAAASADDQVIAIDVLLEPDQTMIDAANMLNVRLRGNYPKGYELDALHAPNEALQWAGFLRLSIRPKPVCRRPGSTM